MQALLPINGMPGRWKACALKEQARHGAAPDVLTGGSISRAPLLAALSC